MKSQTRLTFVLACYGLVFPSTESLLTPATLKHSVFGSSLICGVDRKASRSAGEHHAPLAFGSSATNDASVLPKGERSRERRCKSFWPCQLAGGLPEGDEGIADLESLTNPAKETEYGDDDALQYGVSGAAAGASHQFFSADTRLVFGINALEIGLLELHEMGLARALIVTGWNQARADPVVWELLPRGFELAWHSVSTEPSLTDVAKGASLALEHRADCVVAMGGASVLDAAKVIAAIAYSDKDHKKAARRLVEAAGKPRETVASGGEGTEGGVDPAPLLGPIPLVAIPVVAGVGAEITPMATILDDDDDALEPKKVTMGFHNSAAALPAPFMALLEPRLMMRVPLETTWPRAFVALAGCIEGYVAGRGFVPDLLSQQGIERVSRCLSKDLGFRGPLYQEREDIAFAGAIRGLVASRKAWSFLHRLASAVSVACGAPYAVCVARLFPRVLEGQISALRRDERAFADPSPRRRRSRNRRRSHRRRPTDIAQDARDDKSGEAYASDEDLDADERYDRARAALLKFRRVSRFVLAAGGEDAVIADANKDKRRGGSDPEDIVRWLDARLLDKNVPPLYQAGLRPEHVDIVVDKVALERDGVKSDRQRREAEEGWTQTFGVWAAFREEDVVRAIVEGESARRKGDGGRIGETAEELSEMGASTAQGRTQTGPWNKR